MSKETEETEAAKEFSKQFASFADLVTNFALAQALVFLFALGSDDFRTAMQIYKQSDGALLFKIIILFTIVLIHIAYGYLICGYFSNKEKKFRREAIKTEKAQDYTDKHTDSIYYVRLAIVFVMGVVTVCAWALVCITAEKLK